MYQLIKNSTSILRVADGAVIPADQDNRHYQAFLNWKAIGNEPAPADEPPALTQFEKDQIRYKRRADVQSTLLAYMAADNMRRVRSGVWTVADLTALMADPAITGVLAWMQTLSYEKAAELIAQTEHPLLTAEIKADWISRLQAHFYLEP